MRNRNWTVAAMVVTLTLGSSAFAVMTNEDHFLASDTPGAEEYDTSVDCGVDGYGYLKGEDAAPTGWKADYVWATSDHQATPSVGKYIVGGTGLSYTGLDSSGGAIRYHADKASGVAGKIHGASRKTETRDLKTTLYTSYLVNFNDLIEGAAYKETIDFTIDTHSSGKETKIGLEGGYGVGSDEAKVWLQTQEGTKATTTASYAGGSTMLFVLKLVLGSTGYDSDEAYLYINPDLSLGEPASADLEDTGDALSDDGGYLMYFKTHIHNEATDGGRDLDVYVDEVRAGETWGDVTVPEPATMALLGLGGLGVLLRRKRR